MEFAQYKSNNYKLGVNVNWVNVKSRWNEKNIIFALDRFIKKPITYYYFLSLKKINQN